jgi:hypothetical protein
MSRHSVASASLISTNHKYPLTRPAFECIALLSALNIEQCVYGICLLMVHVSEWMDRWMDGWLFDLQCVVTSPNELLCHEAKVLYKAYGIRLIISGTDCY